MKGLNRKFNILTVFFTLLSFSLASVAQAKEIKVGAVFPMSGPIATYGQESVNAMRLALEDVNKKGPKGMTLKLLVEDNKGESVESANAVRKLINVDKVPVVLGSVASSNTMAGAPIAQDAKVPMMTPASTNVKVTEIGEYISRICFTDDQQGSVMAKFAFNSLKKKKAAIIVDNSSDYSKGLAEVFKKVFAELGGTIIADGFTYQQKDTDFQSLLKRVKRQSPDVVFLPGYYTEVGLILRQADLMGLDVPFLGTDGWDSPKLLELAGKQAIGGNYMSTHFSPDDSDPMVQKFVKDYEKRHGQKPGAMAGLGYDAILVLADALKRAKSTTPEGIKNAINSTKNFKGVTGTITLDKNRNAVKSLVVLETTNSGPKFVERVTP